MKSRRKIKGLVAVLLTAAMVMSAGITSMAEPAAGTTGDSGKITQSALTIQGTEAAPKTGAVFTIYPVVTFDAEKAAGESTYVYTNMKVAEEFKKTVEEVGGLEKIAEYATADNVPSAPISKFAAKLAAVSVKTSGTAYTIGQTGEITLPSGWYLVEETTPANGDASLKSAPILVAVPGTDGKGRIVTVKSSKPDISKEITGEGIFSPSADDKKVGDTVKYEVKADIPLYSAEYEVTGQDYVYGITDTLSEGLTYKEDMVLVLEVDGDQKETLYDKEQNINVFGAEVVTAEKENAGTVIKVTLDSLMRTEVNSKPLYQYAEGGSARIVARYSAELNENAVKGNAGNENDVVLKYDADHETEHKKAKVYTTSLKVIKTESSSDGTATEKKLEGATFKLQKEASAGVWEDLKDNNDSVIELSTDENGELTFEGLEAGTYKLIETKAPDGYSLDQTEREFTLKFDGGSGTETPVWTGNGSVDSNNRPIITLKEDENTGGIFETTITNVKGFVLPGTGGSGTTIFKIVGGVMILLACAMLLVYYKKKGKEVK
ncbi:SpaH/EbpB family LPXTG-anchored major pilin [Clostridium transplantifaecale]|uniref:SpaH/EbpB family LPXTG-anchored major pilin n=1 Tax=Clostridium transplantifaecale TaxID=2479838 RepID=UPI0013DDD744|nr:SpaH/EbpB family LPXTG-anchored major pilin [Clostridium transplantifaecale]